MPTARLLSSLQNDGIYVRIITTLNNNFRTVRIPLESPHAVSRVQLASGYSNTKSNYPNNLVGKSAIRANIEELFKMAAVSKV